MNTIFKPFRVLALRGAVAMLSLGAAVGVGAQSLGFAIAAPISHNASIGVYLPSAPVYQAPPIQYAAPQAGYWAQSLDGAWVWVAYQPQALVAPYVAPIVAFGLAYGLASGMGYGYGYGYNSNYGHNYGSSNDHGYNNAPVHGNGNGGPARHR